MFSNNSGERCAILEVVLRDKKSKSHTNTCASEEDSESCCDRHHDFLFKYPSIQCREKLFDFPKILRNIDKNLRIKKKLLAKNSMHLTKLQILQQQIRNRLINLKLDFSYEKKTKTKEKRKKNEE
jgi:hypothetical protein